MSKKEKAQGLTIPFELADAITVTCLKEQRDYLKSELKQWKKNPKTDANPTGYWLHPEDVGRNEIMIHHLDAVIAYYGGDRQNG
jgi:hypothetical protein